MSSAPIKETDKSPMEIKLATLEGVREHTEHDLVELWLNKAGRIVVRAYNECHNNFTDVDLVELFDWAKGHAL
jgi:hypothetical protein